MGLNDGQEVGDYSSQTNPFHAVLWTGTASSAIDLHPSDPALEFSEATATSGNEQVGEASANGGSSQAFLWFGTAASAVNLNPTMLAGIDSSIAVATNGLQQVGSGFDGSATVDDDQALIWFGTADSVVDLQPALPSSGAWNFSDAYSIDAAGNVFGNANGTFGGITGYFAVEWSPVPEPSSPLVLALAGAITLSLRRSRGGMSKLHAADTFPETT
ncbi:MAG TPA: PEP-CTERM sorting domain-containing protein [Tepidisphaeraceae bacterium]|nr:PEP-CTERM sorting domain-containing protein [Tepidisphaeraceae bacterium]